jgi:basic membrane protein A and related proteins
MKKILALVLALCMVFALAACGESATTTAATEAPATEAPAAEATEAPATEEPAAEATETVSADDIEDTMTSEDGKYEVAFVTDVGQLKDKSFNQGTWNGVKLYAYENGLSYKYYQPANDSQATDDDRYDAMKAAAENGAKVVVCAGYLQATALEKAATDYPDVKFVFIDGWSLGLDNVAAIAFQEEQCGYLAGYAAVMEGFTKLGFCGGGGGTNAACCRYGYGYVQGAEAAAAVKGVNVEMNYTWLYGASFQPSAELQTLVSGWYENGTEIVFSCGGSIFDSITAAAAANDAYVIGVDVDQSSQSDTVVTSALKGIGEAAYLALTAAYDGTWADNYGNNCVTMGAAQNAVGLPVDTWSLENWTVEEYEAMFQQIVDGELVIDDDYSNLDSTEHVTLNVIE